MHQTVNDWMSSPVVVVPPEISAGQGMSLMRRRGIRSLVVDLTRQNGSMYGIVTVSDIRDKIVTRGRRPGNVTIAEIMSAPIECAEPSWSLRKADVGSIGGHTEPSAEMLGVARQGMANAKNQR